ncbi:MAG: SLBB domain-containing protein [Gemmatimonadetes bacterium]|nr:SLBB domain-containing protein [Gemmatimonadota bacterium]
MTTLRRCLAVGLLLLAALHAPRASAQSVPAGDPLRPGDIVRLRIWREPDLSGDFPVDEQGVVVFPKIGPMTVVGQAPADLRRRLVTAYSEFLQQTSIDVTLLRRVQVLGAVRNPGLYPVDPTMTVSDALALAGGTTSDGDVRKIRLIRGGKRMDVKLTSDMRIASSPIRSGDQIFVGERSLVSRNPGVAVAALTSGLSLLLALLR